MTDRIELKFTPEQLEALSNKRFYKPELVAIQFFARITPKVRLEHVELHKTVWHLHDTNRPLARMDKYCTCFTKYVATPGSPFGGAVRPPPPSAPKPGPEAVCGFLDELTGSPAWREAALQLSPNEPYSEAFAAFFNGIKNNAGAPAKMKRRAAQIAEMILVGMSHLNPNYQYVNEARRGYVERYNAALDTMEVEGDWADGT